MKFTEYLRSRVWRRVTLLAYVQILLGSLIGGAAYPLFLNANNIAP